MPGDNPYEGLADSGYFDHLQEKQPEPAVKATPGGPQPGSPQPSAPPDVNPYEGLADSGYFDHLQDTPEGLLGRTPSEQDAYRNKTAAEFLAWTRSQDALDMNQAAEVLGLSALTGEPAEYVANHLDEVRANAERKDLVRLQQESPWVAEVLQGKHGALIKHEVADLQGVERALKLIPAALGQGWAETEMWMRGLPILWGEPDEETMQRLLELQTRASADLGVHGFWERAYVGIPANAADLVGEVVFRGVGGVAGGALGTIPAPVVGTVSGAVAGEFAGGAIYDALSNFTPAYMMIRAASPGTTHAEAWQLAMGASLTTGLIEGAVGGAVARMIPGVKKVLGDNVGRAVTRQLTKTTKPVAFLRALASGGKGAASGAVMMASQMGANAAAAELARAGYHGDVSDVDWGAVDWGTVGDAAAEGFEAGLVDLFFLSAGHTVHGVMSGIGQVNLSRGDQRRLEDIDRRFSQSQVRNRSPEALEEAVDAMAPDAMIYVSIDAWKQAFKSHPDAVAAEVLGEGGAAAYAAAEATGGKLAIPVSQYAARVVGTDGHATLRPHLTLHEDALTGAELEAVAREAGIAAEQAAPGEEAAETRAQARKVIADRLREDIAQVAPDEEAEANADLMAHALVSLATLDGAPDPVAWFDAHYKVGFSGPEGEAGAVTLPQTFVRTASGVERVIEAPGRDYSLEAAAVDPREREQLRLAVLSGRAKLTRGDRETLGELGIRVEPPAPEDLAAVGATPETVEGWVALGLPASEAGRWMDAGVQDPATVQALVDAGLYSPEMASLRRGRSTLGVLVAEGKLTAEEAAAWAEQHGPPWARMGYPNEASMGHGLDPDPAWTYGLAQFAGPGARTADIGKLREARARLDRGDVPEKVRQDTGWFQGKDGKWRFEIDDSRAKVDMLGLDPEELTALQRGETARGRLGQILDHPRLFDAYPHLGHIEVEIVPGMRGGGFTRGKGGKPGRIVLGLKDGKPNLSTLLHEAQHAVQTEEGFASGGSPAGAAKIRKAVLAKWDRWSNAAMLRRLADDTGQSIEQIRADLEAQGVSITSEQMELAENLTPAELAEREKAAAKDFDRATKATDHATYRRLAGEVEARNVQSRMDLTEAERRDLPPVVTEDTRRHQQIVVHWNGADYQANQPGDRGRITWTPKEDGKPRAFNIAKLAGDRSTIAHETFHFFTEVLADIATAEGASDRVKGLYQTLLDHMGYESHQERMAALDEIRALQAVESPTREQAARLVELEGREERGTTSWEAYLLKGKAPTPELRRTFQRFRSWLKDIYRNAKAIFANYKQVYGRDLDLPPEMEALFDTILAADEALEAASDTAPPHPEAWAAMTPEERRRYETLAEAAKHQAVDEVLDDVDAPEAFERLAARRKELRKQALKEVMAQPLMRLHRFLATGKINPKLREALTDKDGNPVKLDRRVVRKLGGEMALAKLPSGATVAQGGVHPDTLAPLFGYETGEAMLRDLMHTKSPDERADALVDERAKAEGLVSPDELQKAVLRRASNTKQDLARAHMLLAALAKKHGMPVPDFKVLVAGAREHIGNQPLVKVRPGVYRAAARKAAKDAAKATGRAAVNAYHRFLRASALAQAAADARADADRLERRLTRRNNPTARARLGKTNPLFRDLTDHILFSLGLVKTEPQRPRPSVASVVDAMKGEGMVPFDAEAVETALAAGRFNRLSPKQGAALAAAVETIHFQAKLAQEAVVEGRRMDLLDVVRLLTERAAATTTHANKPSRDPVADDTTLKRVAQYGEEASARLLMAETMFRMLDGAERGPFWRALFKPFLDARSRKDALLAKIMPGLTEALDEMMNADGRRFDLLDIDVSEDLPVGPDAPFADGKVSLNYLVAIALNWGNAGNRQRLLDGHGWTQPQLEAVLSKHLSEHHWVFVQRVWGLFKAIQPALDALHEQETGLPMGKVEPVPFTITTRSGKRVALEGGYYPVVNDPRDPGGSGQATLVEEAAKTVHDVARRNHQATSTPHGFTKDRAKKVTDQRILLDTMAMPRHVMREIHDITHRVPVKQASKILGNKQVAEAISQRLTDSHLVMLKGWVAGIANAHSNASDPEAQHYTWLVRKIRSNTTTAVLAGSVKNFIGDSMNLFTPAAIGDVGFGQTMVGIASNWGKHQETMDFVMARSAEIRNKRSRFLDDFNEQFGNLRHSKSKTRRWIDRHAFVLMELAEELFGVPAWMAAYRERSAELEADVASGRLTPEEADAEASEHADYVYRRHNTSYSPEQLTSIQRDRGFIGLTTMFYGYVGRMFNVKAGLLDQVRREWGEQASGWNKAQLLAVSAARFALFYGVWNVAAEYLMGRGPGEDDDKWTWLARRYLVAPVADLPFLGQLADSASTGWRASIRNAPHLAAAERLWRFGAMTLDMTFGDREPDMEKLAFGALEQAGLILRLPTSQPLRTAHYLVDLAQGEAEPENAAEFFGGLVYGPNSRGNPGNDLSRLLEE